MCTGLSDIANHNDQSSLVLMAVMYRMRHLTLPILVWQYCLCGLWEGSLTMVVGFRVALDSVNNGTLVHAAAHILCGTVRVKQFDRIRAARVSSEITQDTLRRIMASVPGRWQHCLESSWRTSPRCCIEGVKLFL